MQSAKFLWWKFFLIYGFYTQRGHKLRFFKGGKPQFVTVGIICPFP